MHFHAIKDETWLVFEGIFDVLTINTIDASVKKQRLKAGERIKSIIT